ncbi:aminotransferase class III-fold pyridoxal phosphate-dependent enzyme [Zymobacter palmae]|uniref:Glutamate-1-semialdehyde aminotransferase n=1 Tax=Zymobacter palmae TaxID=33074 RepID=A0A348HFA3_9GAMM|nr:aminotransferase class III-fold pyridoxal phosphate-dependent enzyme [Zymobacter palmae]BBG30305.1 glutamate-1-semialdehyde aminotransferase [Zymobacter palmae]
MDNRSLLVKAEAVTAARHYDIDARPPFIVQKAQGAWLEDCDGRTLLDMTSSNGTTLFGYRRAEIDKAIEEQVTQRGLMFPTTLSPQRIALAERLVDRYAAAEKALFFRTGSEGTSAAIRLVRAYTGRRVILSSGYHGWHDWHRGFRQVCWDAQNDVFHFGYSREVLAHLLEQGRGAIAGVIVTPEPGWYSADDFRAMSQLCVQAGVPFILDEVMSGLRYGPAGLNGAGVPADLLVICKGLANGMALSSVAGKADIIDAYDAAGLAGTYNKEVTPMAAALTALDLLEDGALHRSAQMIGTALMNELQQQADHAGIPLWVTGAPLMFKTVFGSEALGDAVGQACFEHGLFLECNGTHMINFAFGEREKDHAVAAFAQALREVVASGAADGLVGTRIVNEQRKAYARRALGAVFEDDDIDVPMAHGLAAIEKHLRTS